MKGVGVKEALDYVLTTYPTTCPTTYPTAYPTTYLIAYPNPSQNAYLAARGAATRWKDWM